MSKNIEELATEVVVAMIAAGNIKPLNGTMSYTTDYAADVAAAFRTVFEAIDSPRGG